MSTAPRGPSKASYPWTGLATIRLSGCPLPRARYFRGFFVRRWLVLESHITRKIMMDKQYASMELALVDSMREGELAIVTVTPVGRPGATLDVKLENGRIQYLTMTKRMFERLLRGGGVAIVLRVVRIETAPNPLRIRCRANPHDTHSRSVLAVRTEGRHAVGAQEAHLRLRGCSRRFGREAGQPDQHGDAVHGFHGSRASARGERHVHVGAWIRPTLLQTLQFN